MLTYGANLASHNTRTTVPIFLAAAAVAASVKSKGKTRRIHIIRATSNFRQATTGFFAAAAVIYSAAAATAVVAAEPQHDSETPQMLSGECATPGDCKKARIQRPKSRKAESCTIKCVTTCIRGGEGSPGEGPLNVRRPLVVFKQGFRKPPLLHRKAKSKQPNGPSQRWDNPQ